jgi:8-oxo-dGTP pyrophosphatase MutT (NUDIX family)
MKWTVHGRRTLYESEWVNLSLEDVELAEGRRLEHHVIRMPRQSVAVVVRDDADRVLLLWRHRFITDSRGWELAAGVVEDGEDIAVAAARELEEETGWRPGPLQHLMSVEPSNGLTDARHHIFWAEEGEYLGHPVDDFESDRREWVPLKLVPDMVARGEVPAANMAAALLLLHHLRLGQDT